MVTCEAFTFSTIKDIPFSKRNFSITQCEVGDFADKKIMKKYKINHFDSIIISHPANYVNDIFDKIPAVKRIYDCVQRFEFNKYFPPEVVFNDKNIAKKLI